MRISHSEPEKQPEPKQEMHMHTCPFCDHVEWVHGPSDGNDHSSCIWCIGDFSE